MLSKLKLHTVQLEVSRRIVAEFKKQAKRAFPKETFAFLLGQDGGTNSSIEKLWVPEDVLDFTTPNSLWIPEKWRFLAEGVAKDQDLVVLGTVHSHPYRCKDVLLKGSLAWDPAPSAGDLYNALDLGPLIGICTVTELRTGARRSSLRIWGPSVPVEVTLK